MNFKTRKIDNFRIYLRTLTYLSTLYEVIITAVLSKKFAYQICIL